MKKKTWNGQVLAEMACYLLFGGTILYMLLSNRYLSYVAPKMQPYLYFTAAVMLIWTGVSLTGLFRLQRRKRTAHCLILIIPVLLLLTPHSGMSASSLSGTASLLTGNAVAGSGGGLGSPAGSAGGGTGSLDSSTVSSYLADHSSKPSQLPAGNPGPFNASSGAGGSGGAGKSAKSDGTPAKSDGSSGKSGVIGKSNRSSKSGVGSASGGSSGSGQSGSSNASGGVSGIGKSSASGTSNSLSDPGESGGSHKSNSLSEPGKSGGSGSVTASGGSSKSGSDGISSASQSSNAPAPQSSDKYMTTDPYSQPKELHGYDAKNKTITVSSDEYYSWFNEFYTNFDQLKGFSVTVTGSVYKNDPTLEKNQFVPVRLAMTCCVADLTPLGVVCTYDKVSQLKSDEWVTVTGTLYQGEYKGQKEPRLMVTSIKEAKPIPGYIYPY